jgi:hypothetical protein
VVDEAGKLVGEIHNESILSSMVQYRENEPQTEASESSRGVSD